MRPCNSLALLLASTWALSVVTAGTAPGPAKPPNAAAARTAAVDLYGDPLPPGAVARLGTVRFRLATQHGMSGLAFLPDNKTVLTASGNEVQFWDAYSGKMLRELSTRELTVQSFAMATDGKRFAVAGTLTGTAKQPGPGEVRIFDIASGKTLHRFARPDRDVFNAQLTFSPDGALLFSLGYNGILRVEEIASGKERLKKELGGRDYVRGLAVSADTQHLAVASGPNARKLFLWKWQEEEPRELAGPERVRHLAFSPDAKLLAAVSESPYRLHVWEVSSRRLLYQHAPAKDYFFLSTVAFTPDGKTLVLPISHAYGSSLGRIELLDPQTGTSQGVLPGAASRIAVSPDAKLLAGPWGQGLRLWDLTTKTQVATNDEAHTSAPSHLRISPRGLIVTASDDNTVRVWDAKTSKQVRVHSFDNWVRDIALSPDGSLLAASCFDDTVRLFAADSGRQLYRLPGHGRLGGRRMLAFASDGRSFFSFGDDFYLRRWDVRTGRALLEHAIRPSGLNIPDPDSDDFPIRQRLFDVGLGPAVVSPDGKTFLWDIAGDYRFFDVAGGKETRTIAHGGRSFLGGSLTISPNGKYLLASQYGRSEDNAHDVYLRDWASGDYTKITLPGTTAGPVAFSADSRSFAAVADSPDEIRIFETVSGQERRRLRGFRGRVQSLAFFPDGRRLASGHSDSTVLIWDLTAPPKESTP